MPEQPGLFERVKELQKLSEAEKRNDEEKAKRIAEEKERREIEEKEQKRIRAEQKEKERKKALEKKIKKYTLLIGVLLATVAATIYVIIFGFQPAFETPQYLIGIIVLIGFIYPPAFFFISLPAILLVFLVCYGLIPILIGVFAFLVFYFPIYLIFGLILE